MLFGEVGNLETEMRTTTRIIGVQHGDVILLLLLVFVCAFCWFFRVGINRSVKFLAWVETK